MNHDLQTILLADNRWIANPKEINSWYQRRLPDNYVHRDSSILLKQKWKLKNKAHLVVGPRQAGKSTMIWSFLANEAPQGVLYVDCEQRLVQQWCGSPSTFLVDYEELFERPVPIFFDEIQHLENAGLFLKGLVDRKIGVPIVVTGSSSFHLGAKVRESLAGRATRSKLYPFSLNECVADANSLPPALQEREVHSSFLKHIVRGGLPETWLGEDPQLSLTEYVESIVLRDASDLHKIARPDAFRRLLALIAGQVGQLVNITEWASVLGISRDTVAAYLAILESSHIIKEASPFAGGKRAELTGRPKVFLLDNGVRNQLARDFKDWDERVDRGALLENWVFTELEKYRPLDSTLHFWRTTSKTEVDFVLVDGEELTALEVKAAPLKQPKIPRAARSFIDAYKPSRFVMINLSLDHTENIGHTQVRWIKPWQLRNTINW